MDKEIDVWRVTLLEDKGNGGYFERNINNLLDAIKDMDDDSSYVITKKKMAEGEYINLPEFMGF
jgi:hypothetical protein